MATNHSYFWEGVEVPTPWAATAAQLAELTAPAPRRRAAFLEMLSSDLTAVRCIALDYFTADNAQDSFGQSSDDIFRELAPEIRACACRELASAPYERREQDNGISIGANHASALHALSCVGEPGDAAAIGSALSRIEDPLVLSVGMGAAHAVLYREPDIHPALATQLRRVIEDRALSSNLRAAAIYAAGHSFSHEATPWLLEALRDDELTVSTAAGRVLLERDHARFRDAVNARAATWRPHEGEPNDLAEVLELLATPPS